MRPSNSKLRQFCTRGMGMGMLMNRFRFKFSIARLALIVGAIAAAAAIYSIPQVQRIFHEDERARIQRLGYTWSKTGFAEAWQQQDKTALNTFLDGGFILDNELFFSILKDGDKTASYFMSFDSVQLGQIARTANFSTNMCKVAKPVQLPQAVFANPKAMRVIF